MIFGLSFLHVKYLKTGMMLYISCFLTILLNFTSRRLVFTCLFLPFLCPPQWPTYFPINIRVHSFKLPSISLDSNLWTKDIYPVPSLYHLPPKIVYKVPQFLKSHWLPPYFQSIRCHCRCHKKIICFGKFWAKWKQTRELVYFKIMKSL